MRRQWIHSSRRTRSQQTSAQPPNATTVSTTSTIATDAKSTTTAAAAGTATAALKPRRGGSYPPEQWTPEMDAKILDMRLEGNTWHEIGAAVGREYFAVRNRYTRELDPALQHSWTTPKLAYLNEAVAKGTSWRELSEELLIAQSVIREKWISMNQNTVLLETRGKKIRSRQKATPSFPQRAFSRSFQDTGMVGLKRYKWSNEMDALLIDLRNRGMNWRQVGKVFGMVPMTCYMRYRLRLKPRLDSGWTPIKLDISNTPYYLLPNRSRLAAAAQISTEGSESSSASEEGNTALKEESLKEKASVLGDVSEDYLYSQHKHIPARAWTQEEDVFIIKSRESGVSFKDIGERLKADPEQCYKRFNTVLDPTSKHKEWTPHLVHKLLFYIDQGLSWTTIASDLGFHREVCKEKYREVTNSPSLSTGDDGNDTRDSTAGSVAAVASRMSSDIARDIKDPEMKVEEGVNEYDHDTDESSQLDDNVVDDLQGDYRSQGFDLDFESGDIDDGLEDDMLDTDSSEDSEGITDDDLIRTGRWSKKQKSVAPSPITSQDIWDQDSVLWDVKKTWTPEEETALIQHVIRNGTRGWHEISNALGGRHAADECRAYWKHLDMPVHQPASQPSLDWEAHREAQFWRIWLETGSDFEEISRKLSKFKSVDEHETSTDASQQQQPVVGVSAKDCQELFTNRTRQFLKTSAGKAEDEKKFQNDCIEMALACSKPPPFKWDKEKSVRLQKLVRQRLKTRGVHVNWINWKWVARHVGGGVSAQRCNVHWRQLRKQEMEKDSWTDDDILMLEKGLRETGAVFNLDGYSSPQSLYIGAESSGEPTTATFRAIQKFYLPDRSVEAMQQKYFLLSDKPLKVTLHEYTAIMNAVDEFGEDQWEMVVKSLKSQPSQESPELTQGPSLAGWTKAPCRRVWEASYKHQLLYTQWTPGEDWDLKESVRKLGQRDWEAVSRFFPGKSSWQCRLRWCQLTDPVQPTQSPVGSSTQPPT
ncbi:Myblike DNAbinding domain-containing protein [Dissophora ornata]|nr:Myblike DNAbinding domain-containing protein [Dissophora ornata]